MLSSMSRGFYALNRSLRASMAVVFLASCSFSPISDKDLLTDASSPVRSSVSPDAVSGDVYNNEIRIGPIDYYGDENTFCYFLQDVLAIPVISLLTTPTPDENGDLPTTKTLDVDIPSGSLSDLIIALAAVDFPVALSRADGLLCGVPPLRGDFRIIKVDPSLAPLVEDYIEGLSLVDHAFILQSETDNVVVATPYAFERISDLIEVWSSDRFCDAFDIKSSPDLVPYLTARFSPDDFCSPPVYVSGLSVLSIKNSVSPSVVGAADWFQALHYPEHLSFYVFLADNSLTINLNRSADLLGHLISSELVSFKVSRSVVRDIPSVFTLGSDEILDSGTQSVSSGVVVQSFDRVLRGWSLEFTLRGASTAFPVIDYDLSYDAANSRVGFSGSSSLVYGVPVVLGSSSSSSAGFSFPGSTGVGSGRLYVVAVLDRGLSFVPSSTSFSFCDTSSGVFNSICSSLGDY